MREKLMARPPTEGILFEVNLASIKPNRFKNKRKDSQQEWTRQIILEAFQEVKNNPNKYSGIFKTMIPEKTWKKKSIKELKDYANQIGGHVVDWVEQALEWAQRIENGESWKNLCNDADIANWYRLIIWKEGHNCIVGGAKKIKDSTPATRVYHYKYHVRSILTNAVPLIAFYE